MTEVVVAIDGMVKSRINSIHTAIPARVLDFNPQTGCGTVVPISVMVLSDGTRIEYPQIFDVPFVFPQAYGTNTVIAFPVNEGDTCLLVFCENALDRWRGDGNLDSQLKFSLTNAVAIPGLFARPSPLIKEAVDDNAVIIANGSNKIKITNTGIELSGTVTVNGDLNVTGNINAGAVNTQSINTGSCNLHDTI